MNENESVKKDMNILNRLLISLYLFLYKRKRYIIIKSDREYGFISKNAFYFGFPKKVVFLQCNQKNKKMILKMKMPTCMQGCHTIKERYVEF